MFVQIAEVEERVGVFFSAVENDFKIRSKGEPVNISRGMETLQGNGGGGTTSAAAAAAASFPQALAAAAAAAAAAAQARMDHRSQVRRKL